MVSNNWRQIYSSHPEDFDVNGNPLPPSFLQRQREKECSEDLLRGLIQVARFYPRELRRVFRHIMEDSSHG